MFVSESCCPLASHLSRPVDCYGLPSQRCTFEDFPMLGHSRQSVFMKNTADLYSLSEMYVFCGISDVLTLAKVVGTAAIN